MPEWKRHRSINPKEKSRYSEKQMISRKERVKMFVKKQRENADKAQKMLDDLMNKAEPKKKSSRNSNIKLKIMYECPRRSCPYKTTKRNDMFKHIRETGHTTYKALPKSKEKFIK
jgi:hypothetical protein